jgi:WD repeat-containing protein 90
LPYQTG